MSVVLRPAQLDDLDALVALEQQCFREDRLSRRSLRRFIEHRLDVLLVAQTTEQHLAGYCLVLMHSATRMARIYSIAVLPACRGQGVGEQLVRAAEQAAVSAKRVLMRLEVRADNPAAIALYQRLGYRQFGSYRDYYEDHGDALRFERRILYYAPVEGGLEVPYYPQSTAFTCGPAALMMALAATCPKRRHEPMEELQIWREATTIYMLAGHGGCGPHGLALAAWRRGHAVQLWVSQDGPLFLDTVRSEEKKQVLARVHQGFLADLEQAGLPVHSGELTLSVLEQALLEGQVPVILVSTWQLNRSRVPHWVTLCAMDERYVYLHDPEVDVSEGETIADKQYLPIPRRVFERMVSYGKQQPLQAAVIVGRARTG